MKNKTMNVVAVVVALLVSGVIAFAQDQNNGGLGGKAQPVCVIPKIDSDKVPFPLKNANTKYELAENETYILNGFIVNQDGKPFFKIDFDSQPWLATQKRTQFPFFMIDSSDTTLMKKFGENLVQMAVVVRKKDVSNNGQEWGSALVLDIIASPVVIKH